MHYDKVAILAKKVALEFDKLANPTLQKYEITVSQYKILKYLYSHIGESVRQVDLEKCYSLTHPTAIGLLDQLQKKGYVSREPNPEDARSRIIILTDKALEQKNELEQIGDKMEDDLTAALSEEERQTLVFLLKKTLTKFEK